MSFSHPINFVELFSIPDFPDFTLKLRRKAKGLENIEKVTQTVRGVAGALNGEEDIYISDPCFGQLISFEINPISKEICRAKHEYMSILRLLLWLCLNVQNSIELHSRQFMTQ